MKNIFIGTFISIVSISAMASDTVSGKITKIGGQLSGATPSIYFGLSNAPNNRPSCSNHNEYHYVLDPSTNEGKALYSMLLASEATGKTITMKGSGSCGLNQPMETVSYWNFLSN